MTILNVSKTSFINLTIISSIFLLDRLSKLYIIYLDEINNGSEIYQSKFLNIYLIWNEGIAFGLFSLDDKHLYNILTLIILVVIIIILYLVVKNKGFKRYSLIFILGGAIGNLFDRIFYKAVPDFIDFHIENFHWFIFNVSDIFITFGVICMITLELIGKNDKNINQ
jgi:signal peptidase II